MGSIDGDELHLENPQDVGFNEERIVVSVRMRPLNSKEIARHDVIDWECIDENTIIYRNAVSERSPYPNGYTFDRVFRCDCPTRQVYEEAAKKVVLSVVSGINASIFAYGQTSSGKTYTMCGVTAYTVEDIYGYIHRHKEREFVLKFSAMEIYNEAVRDLLSADGTPLRLLDDPERGTVVDRLTEETLRDLDHLKELLSFCETQRQIGETSLNEASSRSHQILRLTIESSAREFVGKEKSSTLAASVDFVDLAGSERASQALSAGTRLKEGCHINRSLLTLGTVIRKLSKGRSGHVPYRDSKLTRILQCSLGGNARTAIICTISPARTHVEQSRNTLQFASCAKEVATNAQVNVVMSDKALVKQLQRELQRLEGELRGTKRISATSDPVEQLKEKDLRIQKLENEIRELIQQRDNAQSRLEDLVHVRVDDQASPQWELFDQPPRLHAPLTLSDDDLTSESSGLADRHCLDVGFTRFNSSHSNGCSESNFDDTYLQLPQTPVDQFLSEEISPRISISDMKFVKGGPEEVMQEEKIKRDTEENTEEICKEVRCIEIEDSTTRKAEFNSLSTEEVEAMLAFSLTGNGASIFDALTSSPQKGGKEFGEVQTELDFDQALPLSPEKGDRELREVETNYGIDNELPLSPQKEDKELREVQTDCDIDQALSLSIQKEDKELREVQTERALDQPLSLSTQKEDRELREVQTEGGIDQPSCLPSQEEDKELREVQKKCSLDKAFSLSPDKADKDLREAQKEYGSEQELSLSSQKGDKELWEIQTEYGILEMKLQDVQKTSEGLVHSFPDDASSLSLAEDASSPRSMKLTRSRSCRANLVTSSASPEQNQTTPSNVYEREFPGRRTSFQGKVTALIFSPNSSKFSRDDSFVSKQSDELKVHNLGNSSRFSREDSFTSEQSASLDEMKVHNIETPPKEDITSIDAFFSGKKEMTKIDCEEDKVHELEPKIIDSEKTVKDVGLDPIDDRTESPSSWSLEFQRQQREIIELWQVCNVSLVHRTYFFLLFKGDPSDSIYMEVEHRRLCFLKERMSQGNNNKMVMEGVADLMPASSMRALRREREMLFKQIQKRMSEEERISLYKKWGIGLSTKQRKQQIARRLWTDTKDMNHIMESASLVARLVGLLEPGQALKEMFGLSFTPQQISRRSYSWKGGMSFL